MLLLGALLPMARVLPRFASSLPGDARGDIYKHVWSYWHATVSPGLWTDYLNAPDGGILLDVMWVPALAMAPLTLLAGPVVASNTWVVLSLFAVGAATAGLAWELTGARWPAVAAGLCAQSSPFLLGYPMESGVQERLAVWVFPLVLLALLRAGRRGSIGWAIAGVLGLAVASLGCQSYAVFAVIMGVMTAPLFLWREERRHPWVLLGCLAGMAFCLLGVWALAHHAALDPDSLSLLPGRTEMTTGVGAHLRIEPATLHGLLDPRAAARPLALRESDLLVQTSYLGWAPLVLGLAGVAVARARRWVGIVVAAGLVSAWMALGHPAHAGHLLLVNYLYQAGAALIPTYGHIPALWQQTAVFGPLAAVGFAALLARIGGRRSLVVGVVGLAAVLAERHSVVDEPIVARAFEVPELSIYDEIGWDGSLVELPRSWRHSSLVDPLIFYAQTRHEAPLAVAINAGSTGLDRYRPVLDAKAESWPVALDCMSRGGIRWVVLRGDAVFDEDYPVLREELIEAAGPPVAEDGRTLLFDLGPAEATQGGVPLVVGGGPSGARRRLGGCPYN
ncbi:MAG TPA: hypothetical protein QGF58_24895 [Myxococcota bacterium]|nr:hypothetical protein [Myxococcota bacterium]